MTLGWLIVIVGVVWFALVLVLWHEWTEEQERRIDQDYRDWIEGRRLP